MDFYGEPHSPDFSATTVVAGFKLRIWQDCSGWLESIKDVNILINQNFVLKK
jgi:hypothetical protein